MEQLPQSRLPSPDCVAAPAPQHKARKKAVTLPASAGEFASEKVRNSAKTADKQADKKAAKVVVPDGATVIWAPQEGPQEAFCNAPQSEIFFGGSRGGGKTDATLGRFILKVATYGQYVKGILFRRELTQLDAIIARSKEIYGKIENAEYVESKKTWTFPNGATLKFRHLDKDSDAEKYQGHDYTDLMFEELTNFPDPKPVMKLKATLRSGRGIPCHFTATGNPGGPGMTWVKKRYIDPAPLGWKTIKETDKFSGQTTERIYIPSRLSDNKILVTNDPLYVARLAQTGSEQQVRAWLLGDWNVIDGAFFPEFSIENHVVRGCELPHHWLRFRCADWGSAKPFAIYWVAVASENWATPSGRLIPKNALVFYREWYGVKLDNNGDFIPNTGLRLHAEAVGKGCADIEAHMPPVTYGVLDPSAFDSSGGPSYAERIYTGSKHKVFFRKADNKRVPGKGAMGGWDTVRARLVGEDLGDGVTRPMVYFFDTCEHLIRTLPMLQCDPDNPEDVDTTGEDHAPDAMRYGCMSRPYAAPSPRALDERMGLETMTFNELWKENALSRANTGGLRRL